MRRRGAGLRGRLALLSLAVLLIPYFGYSYLRDTERHLRESLAAGLADAAGNLALVMAAHEASLPAVEDGAAASGSLYVHSLGHAIQVDGFKDDWYEYLEWADRYGPDGLVAAGEVAPEPGFRLLLGRREGRLYGLLSVDDDRLVHARSVHPGPGAGDRVTLVLARGTDTELLHFASAGPGPLVAYRRYLDEADMINSRAVTNVSGQWQPRPGGWTLEFVLPPGMVGERFGIVVEDVDVADGPPRLASTAGPDTRRRPGRLVLPNPALESLIARAVTQAGRRAWLLDPGGQVLASAGGLRRGAELAGGHPLWRLILPPVSENFRDELAGASRLRGPEVRAALAGATELRWRSSPDGRAVIVSAAAPVQVGAGVAAAVVVEETTGGIQSVQREATMDLFTRALGAFAVVTLILLGFATWLSVRLRRLSRAAEAAIDHHGRVIGRIPAGDAADEIGDLSRSFSQLLRRLADYNQYLEGMAGRLAHELRTPMAVVQSSLENLEPVPLDEEQRTYLGRARAGVARLQDLVARLSEAARLEQALAGAETEPTDLDALLGECVSAYGDAWPDSRFRYEGPGAPVIVAVAPELIVQMLDKLVDNAREFARPGTPVRIVLSPGPEAVRLAVHNEGPPLPDALGDSLFNSMVSVRGDRDRERPHLGLGLYLVRQIAEFHGGSVAAANAAQGEGVVFAVTLPTGGR